MLNVTVANRYAEAYIDLCEGEDQITKIENELSSLSFYFSRERYKDFRALSFNPCFTKVEQKKILELICERNSVSFLTKNLLLLLVEKKRLKYLPSIAKAFQRKVDDKLGRLRSTIISAVKMQEEMQRKIIAELKSYTGKTIVAKNKIDKSALGGVKVEIGGLIIDGSFQYALTKFRSFLSVSSI